MLLHNNKVWNIVTKSLSFLRFLQNHNFANLWFSIKSFPFKTCFRHLKLIGLLCKSKWKMYWKSFLRWQKHLWSESTTILLLRKRHIEYWKLMPGIALAIIYSSRRFGWSHGSSILLTHHCFKVFSCRDDKEKVLLWGGGGWYRHWNWPAKKKYKRAMWSIFQLPCYVFVHHFLIYQQRYWPWLQWQLLHHKRRAQCTEMIYNLIRKFFIRN